MKRFGATIAMLAAAALAASACSPDPGDGDQSSAAPAAGSSDQGSAAGSDGGDASEPYRIVQLIGQNQPGAGALNAKAAAQAVKAAVAVLNENGGVLGHQVELEIIDDGGDPTQAVTKLQERLASGPKPNLILPGNTSAEALPMAPLITEAGILSVQQASADALDDPAKYPYFFKTPPVPDSWAQSLVEYAKEQGATKIAMIAGKDAFGQATAEATRVALKDGGLELVGDETYAAEDLDMTAQLERLKAANPDLVYMQGAGSPVGYVLESREKIGWTDVPLIADSTSAVTSLLNQPAPDGLVGTEQTKNVYVQVLAGAVQGAEGVDADSLETMLKALKAEGEINLPLNVYFAYDAVMLAAKAAEETDTITDAAKQAKWLETVTPDTEGLWALTHYTFTPESHGPAVDTASVAIIPATTLEQGQYPKSE